MSQQNVEIVRVIYQCWTPGDFEGAFARMHTEIEWLEPPDSPNAGLSRGHEGVRRSFARWIGAWDDYRFELRELIDCGDDVLAEGRQSGRGRASGVEISEEVFSVWTLRGGQAVRQRLFSGRAQALEAVGPRE